MLVKLLSNQIPDYRDLIKKTITMSIPAHEEFGVSLIYKELLMDYAQAWIYFTLDENNNQDVKGMLITRLTEDGALGGRILTILAIHTLEGVGDAPYYEGYEVLKEFAKSHDCSLMSFFTFNDRILEISNILNVKHRTTFILASFKDN